LINSSDSKEENELREIDIAVVGATGTVGQVFLNLIEERKFPARTIRLMASARSAGKKIAVNGEELVVEEATPASFEGVDVAFISASTAVSHTLVPAARAAGAVVIDDSSAFRMDPEVGLVVPEVNGDDLERHKEIVAIPNCSTTPLVMVLDPLCQLSPIRRVIADTYQSVSGTGGRAMQELREQARQVLDGEGTNPEVYPKQIAFNLLPHIEGFLDNGYTKEEWKLLQETRKIMHDQEIAVSGTCVRVPAYISHSEAVHIEFESPVSPEEARKALQAFPGVSVLDDPENNGYPTPWEVEGTDDVYVGRIRKDASHPNGLAMWIVIDNLRKGAALNAMQIAEEMLKRDLIE
jgi:aspartate-semialdehyde dehydrogenase